MNDRIFREYDIRGVADRDLPDEVVFALGQGLGTLLFERGGDTLALGRDGRLHSPRIHQAFLAGLLSTGAHVLDVGIVPSPVLYFATHVLGVQGGAQITGSHNPPADNGLKLLLFGEHLSGDKLRALSRLCRAATFRRGQGRQLSAHHVQADYLRFVTERLQLSSRRFPVVLDAGHGAGGPLGLALFQSLGFPTHPLGCKPDGHFPLHPPDPTQPENLRALQQAVSATHAEAGFALDGDADRLVVVDSRGRQVAGDLLFLLLAKAILAEQKGARFVCEVRHSRTILKEIERAGGQPIVWQVGHTRIKEKMVEVQAALGAETSGHLFFAHRYLGFDDGLYAAARVLELLSQTPQTLADLVDALPVLHMTPEFRIPVPESLKKQVVEKVAWRLSQDPAVRLEQIDGVSAFWPDAWALLRQSHTQAAVCLRLEAENDERLQTVQKQVRALISAVLSEHEPDGDFCPRSTSEPDGVQTLTRSR